MIGTNVKTNFAIKEIETPTVHTLLREWADLSYSEINLEIAKAKSKPKRQKTARDALIVAAHSNLLTMLRAENEGAPNIKVLADDSCLKLDEFISPSTILCKTFDMRTGELITFSLKDWLHQHFTWCMPW